MDATPAVVGTSMLFARQDHVHPTDTSRVAKAGDTMTGNLIIQKDTPALVLRRTTDIDAQVQGVNSNNKVRWNVVLGGGAETGASAGSDFALIAVLDDDSYYSTLGIQRSTGDATFHHHITVPGGAGFAGSPPNVAPGYVNTDVGISITDNGGFAVSRAAGNSGLFNSNQDGTLMLWNRSGNTVGTIGVTATNTTYNTSSSGELKEDLQSFDAGKIIDDTRVFDFKWKATGERSFGVIAQQAITVYPNAVTFDEANDWWGIDYSKYVPVLLQELQALRARVAALEGKTDLKPTRGQLAEELAASIGGKST